MKKLLAFFLALVLCLSCFAGCTTKDNTTAPSTTVPSSSSSSSSSSDGPLVPPEVKTITIAEALELCGEEGNVTTERYYIVATIDKINNANFGAMTVSDETGSIGIYRLDNEDGTVNYSEMTEKPYKGDKVLIYCTLQNFNGTKEIKSAYLISFEHTEVEVDQTGYTEMSILEARDAAEGTKVKVTGVVAQITYANGQIPAAIYLVDSTNSILIHDGDLAARVKIGSTVTVLATKTYWILETEQDFADKYGYQGSCQLEAATLVSTDDRTDLPFDRSWIQESTIKDMMETPLSENITTTIYKVNALVTRQEGTGFTNYYFNDLDGKTGSYTYTQCNGSDFAWLNAYDGKICTVYLSIINAKSTTSGCVYRFQPIFVQDESYQFDASDAAKFAVKYHGMDQFMAEYTGDPMLELITSVSSDLLGFKDAKLSYSSSNSSIVSFKEVGGKMYMRGIMPGTATITVTGSYNGKTYSETMEITIGATQTIDALTVQQAGAATAGEEVTVKGIVGPSLVNKTGFYLIDETGVIAVQMSKDTLATLKMGQEVVLKGTRENAKGTDTVHGQTNLWDCEVVTNHYGSHAYSTASFITGKTLADLSALKVSEDHTTEVYRVTAKVELIEAQHYANISLLDGDNKLTLYCSNANTQYAFLKAYNGQTVTVDVAICNWNTKSFYAGCVLAVYNADGTVVYNELNFQK